MAKVHQMQWHESGRIENACGSTNFHDCTWLEEEVTCRRCLAKKKGRGGK